MSTLTLAFFAIAFTGCALAAIVLVCAAAAKKDTENPWR